jgi:predicted metal-dependent hydrolase
LGDGNRGGRVGAPLGFVVRVSPRARRVRLVVTLSDGLVVVVPRGFDQREIPGMIEAKRAWIERATMRVAVRAAERRERLSTEPWVDRPERLALQCLGTEWGVEYSSSPSVAKTTIRERPGRLLIVRGDVDDAGACRAALRRWLGRKARTTIAARLKVLAYEHGFEAGPISVRAQRTRWASCSRRGAISLNAKLLFLPPDLVDYVLLHELCHTVRMDHSAAFWALLKEHDPECRSKRRLLKEAHRHVPPWFDTSS